MTEKERKTPEEADDEAYEARLAAVAERDGND